MRPSKTVLFSYQLLSNVGCEIIIRGSIIFLTRAFPNHDLRFLVSSYNAERDRQILADLENVEVVPMVRWKRYARGVLVKTGMDKSFWTPRFATQHFRNADLFVSVGGDIYTMSGNALPRDWLGYEQFATKNAIPSIMFGANMEKFEVLKPVDMARLIEHLKRFRLIAGRDQGTLEYMAGYGISENTVFFPDPIFMLRPNCVFSVNKISNIGLNVSPLLLRDFGDEVFDRMAKIVTELVGRNYGVTLIPHVYASDGNVSLDDRSALRRLHAKLPEAARNKVSLYDGPMSLADMAREINKVDLFVGARMHSCLNAVTMGKPVYFLSYSSKARTMVEWLSNGPLAPVRDRIAYGAANEVTLEAILSLVAAHETGAARGDVAIDFAAIIDTLPAWKALTDSDIFKVR